MNNTGLVRRTVKTYIDEFIRMTRVHEEEYGQNTKVFFIDDRGEFSKNYSNERQRI